MANSTVTNHAQARCDWSEALDATVDRYGDICYIKPLKEISCSIATATREITKALIDHGVDLEAQNESDLTPLLVTVEATFLGSVIEVNDTDTNETQAPWIEGCATIALLEAGANMAINLDDRRGGYDSFLDVWIHAANGDFCHPDTYRDVLLSIMKRVQNLDSVGGPTELVHKLIKGEGACNFGVAIQCLLSERHLNPADVDALDDDGNTPLLALLKRSILLASTIDMVTILLNAGARLDFVSSQGNTAILSAVSNQREIVRSDEEDVKLMEFLINFDSSLDAASKPGRCKLIDITPTIALAQAAFLGRPNTEYVKALDPETYSKSEKEQLGGVEGLAYFRLSGVNLYWDHDTSKAIGEARYRGHSKVIKLLQSHGASRTTPQGPENEPTYFNAVTMPRTSFFNLNVLRSTNGFEEGKIPRDGDWKFLYELEILDSDWETTALDELVFSYTKLRAWPRHGILNRWPTLQDKLPFTENQVRKENFLNIWYPPRRNNSWFSEWYDDDGTSDSISSNIPSEVAQNTLDD
ncbi:hypothetical protein BJ875DRAFT_528876 [Amylocarpus encephaloides]|uniref:Uncharacterized protein n=1 Tax=Amylocarpus encephaloides TaxID=45428 RepID=A0A9P7Y6D0_9HELO|nr:hypothetical protein BJ875DRAFT_528876 [Amylocarpus encephaloides]